jgi:hypothetical protein
MGFVKYVQFIVDLSHFTLAKTGKESRLNIKKGV